MNITAEQIEDLFHNRGSSLELADGDTFTRDDLVTYIDACDIDTDDDGTPLDDQWQLLADVLGAPDPSNTNELANVTATAHQLKLAEQKRDDAIRAAINAGHSVIGIANAAGLSRARIYQIRDGRR
ncbi:hypothetical protein [Streptomyces sp. NPDC058758]|uniref:hypothetical protein n=1 Tax=Streptomyces sp. NPDC058758 TaxID=3346627 RepID=UPI00367859BA